MAQTSQFALMKVIAINTRCDVWRTKTFQGDKLLWHVLV